MYSYSIVYALTSNRNDHYYNQMLVSILSLRKYMKEQPIIILVDEKTYETLNGERAEIYDYAEVVKVDTPNQYSNIEKSRFIKTSARKFIEGDYLFVDTDTLFCQDISIYIDFSAEFAFVEDTHLSLIKKETMDLKKLKKTFSTLGYNFYLEKKYYNSGVYWAKDTIGTRNFFEKWHNEWKRCQKKGVLVDQPSLNYVNREIGGFISELNPCLNTQISGVTGGFKYLFNVGILHYFNGEGIVSLSNKEMINKIQRDREQILDIIANPSLCIKDGIFISRGSVKFEFMSSETFRLVLGLFCKSKSLFSLINFFSKFIMAILRKANNREMVYTRNIFGED